MPLLKEKSIAKTNNEIIIDAIITTMALLCNSLQLGQLTLLKSSSMVSLMYALTFSILYSQNK